MSIGLCPLESRVLSCAMCLGSLTLLNWKSSCLSRSLWDSWPCRLNLFILSQHQCGACGPTDARYREDRQKTRRGERRAGLNYESASSVFPFVLARSLPSSFLTALVNRLWWDVCTEPPASVFTLLPSGKRYRSICYQTTEQLLGLSLTQFNHPIIEFCFICCINRL